jgi:hypothetical protein
MHKLGAALFATAYIGFAAISIYAFVLFLFAAATVMMHMMG